MVIKVRREFHHRRSTFLKLMALVIHQRCSNKNRKLVYLFNNLTFFCLEKLLLKANHPIGLMCIFGIIDIIHFNLDDSGLTLKL
jgi:hypothetical protein